MAVGEDDQPDLIGYQGEPVHGSQKAPHHPRRSAVDHNDSVALEQIAPIGPQFHGMDEYIHVKRAVFPLSQHRAATFRADPS